MNTLFSFYPTGKTYASADWSHIGRPSDIQLSRNRGWIQQITPPKLKNYKPELGWPKTREPQNHLDHIANCIQSYIRSDNPDLLCFSYKDHSLAERLKVNKIQTVFDDSNSLSGVMYEDYPESTSILKIFPHSSVFDLIICRHYIEHIDDLEAIFSDLRSLTKPEGIIYLEVPDCSIFIERKNPLMLWEQHRHYFTVDDLKTCLSLYNFKIEYLFIADCPIEPSICLLIRPCEPRLESSIKENHVQRTQQGLPDFTPYIQRSTQLIYALSGSIALFGAGHNADRFLQLTNTYPEISTIYDASKSRRGRYLYGTNTPITDDIRALAKNKNIILATHPRDKINIMTLLDREGITAITFDMFSL